jgi:hypothetical protein
LAIKYVLAKSNCFGVSNMGFSKDLGELRLYL